MTLLFPSSGEIGGSSTRTHGTYMAGNGGADSGLSFGSRHLFLSCFFFLVRVGDHHWSWLAGRGARVSDSDSFSGCGYDSGLVSESCLV